MKITKFILITCLLTVAGLYCHAEIPPLEPSVEDPSTGLNVQPGFEVELIYKVDKRKFGSRAIQVGPKHLPNEPLCEKRGT